MKFSNADNLFGLSPYIVDNTNAAYYPTIGSAIAQALADGHSITAPTVVFIRSGTYVEDVVVEPGIFLQGVTDSDPFAPRVIISGSLTANAVGANFYSIQNLTINNPVGNSLILTGTVPMRFIATDCSIQFTLANSWAIDFNCNSGTFGLALIYDCQVSGDDYGANIVNHNTMAISRTSLGSMNLAGANISNTSRIVSNSGSSITSISGSGLIVNDSSEALIEYSSIVGAVFANDTSNVLIHYSSVGSGGLEAINIAAGATCEVIANIINSSAPSTFWATGTGTLATGSNNSLTGTAGVIDPALTLTGYFMG